MTWDKQEKRQITRYEAGEAKKVVIKKVGKLPLVVGIGLTRDGDDYAVKVNLEKEVPSGTIPEKVGIMKVVVEVVGTVSAE